MPLDTDNPLSSLISSLGLGGQQAPAPADASPGSVPPAAAAVPDVAQGPAPVAAPVQAPALDTVTPAPNAAPAPVVPPVAGVQNYFPAPESLFGPQQKMIQDFINSQGASNAKRDELTSDFMKAMKQKRGDKIVDALNSWSAGRIAADAGKNTNMGSILYNQAPDASPYLTAFNQAHQSAVQQRQQGLESARATYDSGMHNIDAQQRDQLQNLGLNQSLSNSMINYGLNTGKMNIELAKFGQEQVKSISDYFEKAVPNPESRAKITAGFFMTANPQAPLADNMKKAAAFIEDAQKHGTQIAAREPADLYDVQTIDGDSVRHRYINAATPEGQAQLSNLDKTSPGAHVVRPATPTTNINMPGAGGEGGKGESNFATDYQGAATLSSTAKAALQLLPALEQNGGTGKMTDSETGKQLAAMIKQGTGIDVSNVSAREAYGKLIKQIQTEQTIGMMKGLGGRTTGREFTFTSQGTLDPQMQPATQRALLDYYAKMGDYGMSRNENLARAEDSARRNNGYFNPTLSAIDFAKKNPVPHFDVDTFGPAQPAAPAVPGAGGPAGRQQGAPQITDSKVVDGQLYYKSGDNWFAAKVGE